MRICEQLCRTLGVWLNCTYSTPGTGSIGGDFVYEQKIVLLDDHCSFCF